MIESVFTEFVGKEVKVPYRDGSQLKVAKGVLEAAQQGFVKVVGPLGMIIIRETNVEKLSIIE